jgi:adenylylsulfate kinase
MTGGIVWFTGLSGAGKSTLATALGQRLASRRSVEVLDGDELRLYVSAGLGFSREDRDINVHRIAYIARLLAKHAVLVFVAAISPYSSTRAAVRRLSESAGHPFVEVFVDAPLDAVVARDVKGLYRRALAGEIPNFTGVSDPYESPSNPEIVVRTGEVSQVECEAHILAMLARHELVEAT